MLCTNCAAINIIKTELKINPSSTNIQWSWLSTNSMIFKSEEENKAIIDVLC